MQLKDGTQITAENISVLAKKLLEVTAAENTHTMSQKSSGLTIGSDIQGSFLSLGMDRGRAKLADMKVQQALLKARKLLKVLSEGEVRLKGAELEAREVDIQAVKLVVESLQDRHESHSRHWSASASSNGAFSGSYHRADQSSRQVAALSVIRAEKTIQIIADEILQKGSLLDSERLIVKGLTQDKPNWTFEDIADYDKSSSLGLSLNGQLDRNNKPQGKHKDAFPVKDGIVRKQAAKAGTDLGIFCVHATSTNQCSQSHDTQ